MKARHRRDGLACFLLVLLLPSRLSAAESPVSDRPVAPGFQRERVNLILIDVVVTDRKGRSVDDLRHEDFSLWVDGHPHEINSVELRWAGKVTPGGPQLPAPTEDLPPGADRSSGSVPIFSVQSPRRFIFLLDGLNGERGLGPRPIQAVRTFLQTNLLPGDEVMVAGLGKEFKIYQDFTSDPALMLKAIEAVEADPGIRTSGENRVRYNMRTMQEARDLCDPCGAAQKEEAAQRLAVVFADEDRRRIRRTLASLRAVVASLNAGTGRKELFFLTEGFPADPDALYGSPGDPRTHVNDVSTSPASLDAQILQISREAGAAQVAIHTVNTQGVPRGTTMMLRSASGTSTDELIERSASNTLAGFALGTGGVATRGTDNFLPALQRVEQEARATYVVSYVPSGDPDGLFHATRVEVRRKGVRVRANEGFVWLTEEQSHERQLFSAYMAPELFRDFPLAVEVISYLEKGKTPAVEFAITVPDQMLLFLPQSGEYVARLEAGVALRLGQNQIADRFSRSVEARLTAQEMASQRTLTLVSRREIPPGDYEAVAVVRDLGTGNIGALRIRAAIPAMGLDRMAMSSLVMESPGAEGRRVDLEPATVGNSDLIVPAAFRVFPRGALVQASCLIYHPKRRPATGESSFQVRGFLRRGGVMQKEFPAAVHVFTSDQDVEAIPLRIPISLVELEPGTYSLQVQVLDQVGNGGIVQSVDFMVQ